MKRLVNFRAKMPKASTVGRGGSKRKTHDQHSDEAPSSKMGRSEAGGKDTWRRSRCSDKDLLQLVAEGLL
jgi:hypothetical protein